MYFSIVTPPVSAVIAGATCNRLYSTFTASTAVAIFVLPSPFSVLVNLPSADVNA